MINEDKSLSPFLQFIVESRTETEEELIARKGHILSQIRRGGGYNPYWHEEKKALESEIKDIEAELNRRKAVDREAEKHDFKIGALAPKEFNDASAAKFIIDRYQHLSANKKPHVRLVIVDSPLANRVKDQIEVKKLDIKLEVIPEFPDLESAYADMIYKCDAFIKILFNDSRKNDYAFTNIYSLGLTSSSNSRKPIRVSKV